MTRHAIALSAAIVSALALATDASAQTVSKPDPVAARLFADKSGAKIPMACFARVYDAAHLARHPKQKIASMMLLFSDERETEETSAMLSFKVGLKLRGQSGRLETAGSCGHASAEETGASSAKITCGVDCDGGGFDIEISADNASLRVGLDRIVVQRLGKNDEDMGIGITGGSDDRVFRLERVALRDCLPLVADKRQIASLRTDK